jgi:hypothetical protein
LAYVATQGAAWNIPATELTELKTVSAATDAVLTAAQSSERTPVVTPIARRRLTGWPQKCGLSKAGIF